MKQVASVTTAVVVETEVAMFPFLFHSHKRNKLSARTDYKKTDDRGNYEILKTKKQSLRKEEIQTLCKDNNMINQLSWSKSN